MSPMTQKANPVTLLASPLGEEGHEVAKGVQANWIHRGALRPYESSSFATSRGNEKIGGTGYCVTYDTDSQSRNADFISIARRAIRHLQRRRRCRPLSASEHNPPPSGGHNPRGKAPSTFPSEPSKPYEPSRRRRVQIPLENFPVFLYNKEKKA